MSIKIKEVVKRAHAHGIPVLVGQVTWVLVALFGIWYITRRVPTKRE